METSIRTDTLLILCTMGLVVLSPLLFAFLPWKTKLASRNAAILLGLSAVLLVVLAALFDGVFGISASWGFTISVWVLGVGICLAVRFRHPSFSLLVIIGLLTAFVLGQHFMDWSPVKPYKRFFAAVESGMTKADVLKLLRREFPDGFRFPRPMERDLGQEQMSFVLDPTERAWKAEAIFIYLSNGRVVRKEYSRD
jgi:hypothetical protein